jgi:hypothetical protein
MIPGVLHMCVYLATGSHIVPVQRGPAGQAVGLTVDFEDIWDRGGSCSFFLLAPL